MRKQLLFVVALILGVSTAALAQVTNSGTITTTGAATCVTANSCVRLPATGSLPANSGAVSIQLGVTAWTGTVTIETTTDGTNYVTAQNCVSANATVTTMTANGQVQCNVSAVAKIQVRGTGAITGTLTVTMTSSVGSAKNAPPSSGPGSGTVTSITATGPIVVTPSPLTTTGVISCPTCGTGTLSGTTNFLSKFTSATAVGNSQAFESLTADEFFIRLGTAGAASELGTFFLTTDSTGDTTPAATNEILFATRNGAAADEEFANIQAGVTSTSAGSTLDIHTFKIGNGSNDDRILNYTFNDTTDVEVLQLADVAIEYRSNAAAYPISLGWDTQVSNDTGFRAFTTKIGNTTVPTAYIDNNYQGGTTYDKGGTTVLNAGGNALDPLPLPKLNSTYNAGQCVGYSAAPGDLCGLFVWNGDARISDPTDNYVQLLNEPDFVTTTKWAAGGGFSFGGAKAIYGGGGGTLTQAQADLVGPALGNRYYSFSYVTSSVTGTPECNLQSLGWDVYTGSPHSLSLTAGAHILDGTVGPAFYFRTAAAAPADFVITCSGTGTVSFDDLFLSLSAGGNLTVDGNVVENGLLTVTGASMAAGGGNVAIFGGSPGGNTYIMQIIGPDGSFANNSATLGVSATESDSMASGFVRAASISAIGNPASGTFSVVRGSDISASSDVAMGATVTDVTALLLQAVAQGVGTTVTARGLKIEVGGASVPTNAIAIETTDLGDLIFGALKTTGAATGKTVVCVDTATGKLYASSSGVACAN